MDILFDMWRVICVFWKSRSSQKKKWGTLSKTTAHQKTNESKIEQEAIPDWAVSLLPGHRLFMRNGVPKMHDILNSIKKSCCRRVKEISYTGEKDRRVIHVFLSFVNDEGRAIPSTHHCLSLFQQINVRAWRRAGSPAPASTSLPEIPKDCWRNSVFFFVFHQYHQSFSFWRYLYSSLGTLRRSGCVLLLFTCSLTNKIVADSNRATIFLSKSRSKAQDYRKRRIYDICGKLLPQPQRMGIKDGAPFSNMCSVTITQREVCWELLTLFTKVAKSIFLKFINSVPLKEFSQ